jgi:hypothetical protein
MKHNLYIASRLALPSQKEILSTPVLCFANIEASISLEQGKCG